MSALVARSEWRHSGGSVTDAVFDTILDEWCVNRRGDMTPPVVAISVTYSADRHRNPAPIHISRCRFTTGSGEPSSFRFTSRLCPSVTAWGRQQPSQPLYFLLSRSYNSSTRLCLWLQTMAVRVPVTGASGSRSPRLVRSIDRIGARRTTIESLKHRPAQAFAVPPNKL